MYGTADCCLFAVHAIVKAFHIGIDNNYRVIDNHSQSTDQCRQRNGVQLDVEGMEKSQGDENGYRNG